MVHIAGVLAKHLKVFQFHQQKQPFILFFVNSNGCEDFAEVTVTVNTEANAYAGEDVAICQGESTTLTATGGTDYLWSTGETTQSITVNPTATSNYTVIVSNDFSSDTDDVTVVVNPMPNVEVTGDVSILQGEFCNAFCIRSK